MENQKKERWIIHLDMDSFFAAVEVLDNPDLKGCPVIVGGIGSRGVVSTASYEARAYGVHSAQPIGEARKLCPHGVFLWPRMGRYKEISEQVMAIFHRYTPLVEPLSLDEAFLDVSGSLRLFGPAPQIASRIRAEVFSETALTVSAGVATQKHLAKIASGFKKPDAMTVIPAGEEQSFLRPLGLKYLWGVGKVTLKKLEDHGFKTIGDLADQKESYLYTLFGESGRHFWRLANCLDLREVEPEREAKSVGAEETYQTDIWQTDDINRELLALSVKVARRLRDAGLKGYNLTLKIRDFKFKTNTRSKTINEPFEDHMSIYQKALELFPKDKKGPWRLLGISISNLCGADEPVYDYEAGGLFGEPEKIKSVDPRLSEALDLISNKFGEYSLIPATLLEKEKRK